MGRKHARTKHQITEGTRSSTSIKKKGNSPSRSRRPSRLHQPDYPRVASPTTNPNQHLQKLQAATICAGRGGSNTNTTERPFRKNNYTIPSSSSRNKATASLLQPNQKQAAMLSDANQGHSHSALSSSSKKGADDAVSNESTVLDNYPNLKKQIQPIIRRHRVKKKRSKSADPSFRSSKMPIAELRMDAALGNTKNSLPLNKTERKEDWKSLIDSIAAGYVVSDPVDTTNTDSPSASSNVGKADDLNEASDLSQNQSKCGYFFIIGEVESILMYKN